MFENSGLRKVSAPRTKVIIGNLKKKKLHNEELLNCIPQILQQSNQGG
jgi:hypothetical protein